MDIQATIILYELQKGIYVLKISQEVLNVEAVFSNNSNMRTQGKGKQEKENSSRESSYT